VIIKASGGAWPKAILLDLDGTLIDSDHAHQWTFGQILAPYGVTLTTEMFEKVVVGNNNETIMRALLPQLASRERVRLAADKEKLVLQNLHLIALCSGARELVANASDAGTVLAVVTNAPRENALAILSHFELLSSISTLVALEDTTAPKPSAAPYLEALRRLGAAATEAVAFEDSVAGVTSAVRAGIRVYGVRGYRPETALLQAGAFACVATLGDASFG
jgi:HAD superfamily hydrolase (TIGR01509 family)